MRWTALWGHFRSRERPICGNFNTFNQLLMRWLAFRSRGFLRLLGRAKGGLAEGGERRRGGGRKGKEGKGKEGGGGDSPLCSWIVQDICLPLREFGALNKVNESNNSSNSSNSSHSSHSSQLGIQSPSQSPSSLLVTLPRQHRTIGPSHGNFRV